jgi:hypothetical protein
MLTKFRYFLLGIAVALVSFMGQNAFAGGGTGEWGN